MGGETVDQARGTASMMNVPPENGDADAGGGAVFSRHADVEKKLARFAEVAASNPNVSHLPYFPGRLGCFGQSAKPEKTCRCRRVGVGL